MMRLTIDIDDETAALLGSLAEEHGWTPAETIREAIAALEREVQAEHEADARVHVPLRGA